MENTLLNKTENECSSPSNIGAVLLAACPEESGTNSSALTTSATGSAGERSTSSASASRAQWEKLLMAAPYPVKQVVRNSRHHSAIPVVSVSRSWSVQCMVEK